jgi:hypothetical protein
MPALTRPKTPLNRHAAPSSERWRFLSVSSIRSCLFEIEAYQAITTWPGREWSAQKVKYIAFIA